MRDRFADFQKTVDHFDEVELESARPSSVDRLDSRIQELRNTLDALRTEVATLRRKQQHILSLTVADPRDKDVLEDQIATIRRKSVGLAKAVREVEEEFKDYATASGGRSNAETKIRKNQIDFLKQKLRDVINEFNDTHVDYKSRVSVRVKKQMQAVGHNVTDTEVQEMLRGNAEQLFYREVNPLSVSGRAALEDVKQRNNEMLEIEKNIEMLHDIMVDMQHLTEIQGEMVDNIEKNVDNTQHYVRTGAQNVKTAVEYKKAALRKKIGITVACIVVLLLIIVAIILGVVLSGRK